MKRTLPISITVILALASQAEAEIFWEGVLGRKIDLVETIAEIDAAMVDSDPLLFAEWQLDKAETVPYIISVVGYLQLAVLLPPSSPTHIYYVTAASALMDVAESIIEPWKNFIEPPMQREHFTWGDGDSGGKQKPDLSSLPPTSCEPETVQPPPIHESRPGAMRKRIWT